MWGGVLNDKVCGNSVFAQWDKNTSFLVSFKYRNIDRFPKKIHNFCVKQITERIFLKRFIPKAYNSCIEKQDSKKLA